MSKRKMCYPRTNKKGEIISYRICNSGKDPSTGKNKLYTMTWKVPKGLSQKEIDRLLKKTVIDFDEECEKRSIGLFVEERQIIFGEFANEWLSRILLRNEESYSYYARAERTVALLNEYFGDYLLTKITPNMVQRFYDSLCERTYSKEIVTVKKSIYDDMDEQIVNKTKLADECGINRLTLRRATKVGTVIDMATAKSISKKLHVPINKFFSIERKEVRYSKSTNNGIRTILVVILGEAKRQQLIEHNYASKDYTRPMTGTTKEKEIFDEQESREFVKAVLNETHPKKRTIFSLFIFLGLRKAEACGLMWDNIDFENKTLSVTQNNLYFSKFGIVSKKPKTIKSARTISIPNQMITILKDYKSWYDEQKKNYGDIWEGTDFLFLQDNGKPMNPCTVNAWLRNFNLQHGFKNISPHSLRHTCITMQINAGIPLKVVSTRAGHSSERTTLDIYTHSLQSQDIKAAEVYDSFLCS